MIIVEIDVAKDKHDCFIVNSEGEVLADVLTVANSKEGFEALLQAINKNRFPTKCLYAYEPSALAGRHGKQAYNALQDRLRISHNQQYIHTEPCQCECL